MRAQEWLFSAEGQCLIVVSSNAARLVLILLDSSNSNAAMEDIQEKIEKVMRDSNTHQFSKAKESDGELFVKTRKRKEVREYMTGGSTKFIIDKMNFYWMEKHMVIHGL